MDTLKTKITQLTDNPTFRIFLIMLIVWAIGSFSIIIFENGNIDSIGDAIWWTIVTITTVGYGDFFPLSLPGRILAIIIMMRHKSLLRWAYERETAYVRKEPAS